MEKKMKKWLWSLFLIVFALPVFAYDIYAEAEISYLVKANILYNESPKLIVDLTAAGLEVTATSESLPASESASIINLNLISEHLTYPGYFAGYGLDVDTETIVKQLPGQGVLVFGGNQANTTI